MIAKGDDTMPEPKKSFVFFSSWERYLKTLELDKDINYVNAVARAIIQYGISGEIESTDPTILSRVEAVCADLMQSSSERYNAALKGGTTGGRPRTHDHEAIKQMHKDGVPINVIADTLGCSTRTVKRALESMGDEDEI
jgi:DNA-binding NarL/FixJ family response regulator